QRARLNELQERVRSTAPVAFLSVSTLLRGVTRELSWFNPTFRVFSPHEFPEALAHLGIPAARGDAVKGLLLELEQEMGGIKLDVVRAVFGRKSGSPRGSS